MLDILVNYLGPAAFIGALIAVFLWRIKYKVAGNITFAVSAFLLILANVLPIKTLHFANVVSILSHITLLYFMWRHEYRNNCGFFANILKAFGKAVLAFFCLAICIGLLGEFIMAQNCEEKHTTTQTTFLLSATDDYAVNGSTSGGGFIVYYVSGSVSEKAVYRYYYQLDDGGFKQGQIPASATTIYYIDSGELPYLETIIETKCSGYSTSAFFGRSVDEPYHFISENNTETTYKLYVPEGSIQQIFQFDGN